MANSNRKRILDNLVSTIAAITVAGGYNLGCGQCVRGYKHFNQVPEDLLTGTKFAAYVAGADEKRKNNAQRTFHSEILASVLVYVLTPSAENTVQLEQDLDSAIEDITKALMVDVTRGGYAITTEITDIDTDKGSFQPYAGAEILVRMEYRASVSTP